jgi:hypothetical protein
MIPFIGLILRIKELKQKVFVKFKNWMEWKKKNRKRKRETMWRLIEILLNWTKLYNIPINIVFKFESHEKVEVKVNIKAVLFNEMLSIKG